MSHLYSFNFLSLFFHSLDSPDSWILQDSSLQCFFFFIVRSFTMETFSLNQSRSSISISPFPVLYKSFCTALIQRICNFLLSWYNRICMTSLPFYHSLNVSIGGIFFLRIVTIFSHFFIQLLLYFHLYYIFWSSKDIYNPVFSAILFFQCLICLVVVSFMKTPDRLLRLGSRNLSVLSFCILLWFRWILLFSAHTYNIFCMISGLFM